MGLNGEAEAIPEGDDGGDQLAWFINTFGAADEIEHVDNRTALIFRKEGIRALFVLGKRGVWDHAGFVDVASGLYLPGRSALTTLAIARLPDSKDGVIDPPTEDWLASVLKCYGPADVVESNENDQPRPAVVVSKLTYRREQVQIVLVMNHRGAWELGGFVNSFTKVPIGNRSAMAALLKRGIRHYKP